MASCRELIEDTPIEDVLAVFPNNLYPFDLNQPGDTFLMTFEIIKNETILIDFSMYGHMNTISTSVTVFREGSAIGTTTLQNPSQQMQIDVSPGRYFLCFSTRTYNQAGIVRLSFTSFNNWVNIPLRAYQGSDFEMDLSFDEEEYSCKRPVRFYVTEGSLPPGLSLSSDGNICGVIENLDCVDELREVGPAVNWFFDDEQVWSPLGWAWRFKVRCEMIGFEDYVYDDAWFIIRVLNDWSADRDKFIENFPMFTIESELVPQSPAAPTPAPEIPEVKCCIKIPDVVRGAIFGDVTLQSGLCSNQCKSEERTSNSDIRELPNSLCCSLPEPDVTPTVTPLPINIRTRGLLTGYGERNPTDLDFLYLLKRWVQNQTLRIEARVYPGTCLEMELQ